MLATAILFAAAAVKVAADSPFVFCTDSTCGDCPSSVTSAGTGYPACVVYNTKEVLAAGAFQGSDGGGFTAYLEVPEPDAGCAYVIKSPAATDVIGCGTTIGAYKHATCSVATLKETFMVQFCCGSGDCAAAGAGRKMIRGTDWASAAAAGGSSEGVMFKYANGTVIQPVALGMPQNAPQSTKREAAPVMKKRNSCNKWNVNGDPGGYTRPADAVQIVVTGVNGGTGGAMVTVDTARESSFSSTVEAGVGLEIFSASVSFTYEMSVTESQSKSVSIPAGSVGNLGFTPTLRCTMGTLECDDGTQTGEACTGFKEGGDVAGTYAVINRT